MELDRKKYIRGIFTLLAVFCGMIWSFTNLSYDGEYQIAMSYRLLQGDRMLLEMWEPHQTSAFLPAALMWIYRGLFHTTTGIVLYLQICGIAIRGGIAYLLYRVLRIDLGETAAYGIGLFYFMVSPKDYALPEFSNQLVWYSALLLCSLWEYLKKGRSYLLILGAVWLCLEILAYPSCVIVYFGAAGILLRYSSRRWRDILLFSGVCTAIGIGVVCVLLRGVEPEVLAQCIEGMFALEPTHTVSMTSKALSYMADFLEMMLVLLAAGGVGLCVSGILGLTVFRKRYGLRNAESVRKHGGERRTAEWKAAGLQSGKQRFFELWILCACAVMLTGFLANILSADKRNAYSVILMFLSGAGLWMKADLTGRERQLYVCGSVIGGLGFLSALILTDLSLADTAAYGLPAIVCSVIPIKKRLDGKMSVLVRKGLYGCFLGFIALLAFRCAYIRTPLSGRGQICSSLSDLSVVRSGPAWGIISNEAGVCIQRDSYPEWKELIRPGDKVWIIGGVLDTLGYLYEDVEVAAPSTMSTPYYSSAVLDYWRLNPDKYPDVIVAEGYLGELLYELENNQWLMSWLWEEYRPESVVDGKYWIYYFKRNGEERCMSGRHTHEQ